MRWIDLKRDFRMNKGLYALIVPIVIYIFIFNYLPMGGIIMCFERFSPKNGVFFSEWVGLKHFIDFFSTYYFWRLMRNTLLLSIYGLLWGYPAPIIYALLLNELENEYFKKAVQVISYMPNFISTVVICGIIIDFVSSDGLITDMLVAIGFLESGKNLLSVSGYFRTIMIASDLWQQVGFGSILFLATLTGIDQELYEAALIDGAGRWKQTIHVTIPGLMPVITIMLIQRVGGLLGTNMEKIILLYNPLIYETADTIGSFVYRKGLQEANYGYSSAVGMFNSIVGLILLCIANGIARKYGETSLF